MNNEPEFHEAFFDFLRFYEESELEIVTEDKERIEFSSDRISEFIDMFNESLRFGQKIRAAWLVFRYGAPDNFKLLIEWIHYGLGTEISIEKQDNLAQSQENILKWLIRDRLIKREDILQMIKVLKRREFGGFSDRPRKLLEFHLQEMEIPVNYSANTFIPDQPKYNARHYVLAYLFECNASGVRFPIGNKSKLENEGNQRIGKGKGNRFYKAFNEITSFDLNVESNLKTIGGDHWREAIIQLSKNPASVEEYLQSKGL